MSAQMRYCVFCGEKLPAVGSHCPHCGKEQPRAEAAGHPLIVTGRSRLTAFQSLSRRAEVILAVAALLSGAGPGAIAQLLGVDPLIGLVANILSTAPLSLGVALIAITVPALAREDWAKPTQGQNPFAVWLLVALIAFGSLLLATVVGGVPGTLETLFEGGGSGLVTLPFRAVALYFDVYGWSRFILAVIGGMFLWYVYTSYARPMGRRRD